MVLFLSNLEIPVVTTALVGISEDLKEFRKSPWVTTSYLLGYAGENHQTLPKLAHGTLIHHHLRFHHRLRQNE